MRTYLDINAVATSDHYEITSSDNRDTKAVSALLLRQLNPSVKADLGLSYEKDNYTGGGSLKQLNLLASVRWRLGQRLGLRFIYAHTSISPNSVSENQIGVTVAYNLLGPRGTGHGNDAGDAPGLPTPQLRPTNRAMQPRL